MGGAPRETRSSRALVAACLLLLLALGLALRVHDLDRYLFLGDDAFHLLLAERLSPSTLDDHYRQVNHPPLFYLATKAVLAAGAQGVVAVRAVPLLAGLLLIFSFYGMGRSLRLPGAAALVMAHLAATSLLLVELSQEIREYTLTLVLLCGCVSCLYWRPQRPALRLVAYATLALLAVLTLYGSILLLAATALVELANRRRSGGLGVRFAGAWLAFHVLLAGLVLVQGSRYEILTVGGSYIGAQGVIRSVPDVLGKLWEVLRAPYYAADAPLQPLVALFAAAGTARAALARRLDLLILIGLPFVLNVAVSVLGLFPFTANRWCSHLMLSVAIAVGCACSQPVLARERACPWLVAACFVLAFTANQLWGRPSVYRPNSVRTSLHWAPPREELRALEAFVRQRSADPPDRLLVSSRIRIGLDLAAVRPAWRLLELPRDALVACPAYAFERMDNATRCIAAERRAGRGARRWWVLYEPEEGELRQRLRAEIDACARCTPLHETDRLWLVEQRLGPAPTNAPGGELR